MYVFLIYFFLKTNLLLDIGFLTSDEEGSVISEGCGNDDLESGNSGILDMVNFLAANKNKIMQICLEEDKNLDLNIFELIFQSIIKNDNRTALAASNRITALIFDILDANKTKNT